MSSQDADALPRHVITEGEYGEDAGHGVGLAVQEKPKVRKVSRDVLYAGMTLAIERGTCIPGCGAVRIEDLVVIGAEGVEVLS